MTARLYPPEACTEFDDDVPEPLVVYDPVSELLDEFEDETDPLVSVVDELVELVNVPVELRLELPDDEKLRTVVPVAVEPLPDDDPE